MHFFQRYSARRFNKKILCCVKTWYFFENAKSYRSLVRRSPIINESAHVRIGRRIKTLDYCNESVAQSIPTRDTARLNTYARGKNKSFRLLLLRSFPLRQLDKNVFYTLTILKALGNVVYFKKTEISSFNCRRLILV